MLKRLCDKGLFENNNGTVTSKMSREMFYTQHSRQYVAATFGGSLPAFLAAFTGGGRLTEQERAQLQALLDRDDENRRTYHIARRKGMESSYAADILRQYGLDGDSLLRRFPEKEAGI